MRKRSVTRLHPPLVHRITRRVRFNEVDQLAYMWHGHYVSWFEDGREAFGAHYGMRYMDFYDSGVIIPLTSLQIDYKQPLRYDTTYTIETSLLWNDAAVIEFHYRILDAQDQCMTQAASLQLMLDRAGTLLLDAPPFYKALLRRWAEGA